ncbi:hypothetical protein GGR50DRAFT_662520 [Xylaria sp. CBS 124048]|nr:hypothetical protein GGR50DRAFT_662520 [Xylaria sp. CBS 124048]
MRKSVEFIPPAHKSLLCRFNYRAQSLSHRVNTKSSSSQFRQKRCNHTYGINYPRWPFNEHVERPTFSTFQYPNRYTRPRMPNHGLSRSCRNSPIWSPLMQRDGSMATIYASVLPAHSRYTRRREFDLMEEGLAMFFVGPKTIDNRPSRPRSGPPPQIQLLNENPSAVVLVFVPGDEAEIHTLYHGRRLRPWSVPKNRGH